MFVVVKFLKTANQVFPLTLWFSLQIARLMHISHSSSYHIVAGKQEHEHYINTHVLEQEQKPHFKFLTWCDFVDDFMHAFQKTLRCQLI